MAALSVKGRQYVATQDEGGDRRLLCFAYRMCVVNARAIGDVLNGTAGPKLRRTFQPVRRDSRHAGEREHRIWRPLGSTKREAFRFRDALLEAAERFDELGKGAKQGSHSGPLGYSGVRVLKELLRIVDFKTGRLEPAIATICERIQRSRATVVRALARLKEHGFLDWIRRTEPTDNVGAGPQVRQITNAYGFDIARLPKMAAAWIRKRLADPPTPDCEAARRQQDAADVDGMLGAASAEEAARFRAGGSPLGDALAALGRSLDRSASLEPSQNPEV